MGSYLGQNFLSSQRAIQSIVKLVQDLQKQTGATACVEIGPGKGAITKDVHQLFDHFVVIEKDPKMISVLENTLPHVQKIHDDALEFDYETLGKILQTPKNQTLIIGNLPYYITSPLLRTFLEPHDQSDKQRAGGLFMIQKEVGEKITYDANKKSFLWRLVNNQYQVRYRKTIPAKAFTPAPRVESCLVSCHPLPTKNMDQDRLIAFLDLVSGYKRKTLGKIEKILLKKGELKRSIPDSLKGKRLEELGREEMGEIIQHSRL